MHNINYSYYTDCGQPDEDTFSVNSFTSEATGMERAYKERSTTLGPHDNHTSFDSDPYNPPESPLASELVIMFFKTVDFLLVVSSGCIVKS